MLGRQLRRRGDLDALDLLQRALRERREERESLDLDVEELAANRAFLGRRVDVDDVAAEGELAALLDLLDALVPARDELRGGFLEIEQGALLDGEPVRAQLGVGHLLGERHRAGDHDRGPALRIRVGEQVVDRRDPQADQVRRRGEVRLVAHSARRVEAHRARAEELLQVGGEVARGPVVAGHHEGGPVGLCVEHGREQVGPHARRHEHALRVPADGLGQGLDRRILVGICEQLA